MDWPPQVGRPLPRAADALGVLEKLEGYSLNSDHVEGGPKANGFAVILGITADAAPYLEAQIRAAIKTSPVSAIRVNPPHGINCVVEFPIRGIGSRRERVISLRTIWLTVGPGTPPRLITALLKP